MVTPANSSDVRPKWFVTGGRRWSDFSLYWRHPNVDGSHKCNRSHGDRYIDVVGEMQQGDLIAMKADDFSDRYRGDGRLSVGIYAVGTVDHIDGDAVYVDWRRFAEGPRPLANDPVDTIADRFAADQCIWRVEPDDNATLAFITEVFGAEAINRNPPDQSPSSFSDLADNLYLPADFLQEINALLEDKKQVIFQGPPGTGKTYVAQKLAEHIAGSKDHVTLVQFHPSYDYVDFVQGYRPAQLDNGQPGFRLLDGPLLQAAKQAEAESDAKHFLIIDEINRGNLAKVFGELYFLLEYRDSEINLQYSDKPFRLPPNLYIIGTMNTADRSIALVDLALRRRFYFVEFHPDKPPIKSLLRRYLDKNPAKVDWLADVVDRANELLSDEPHAAVGPSHFMKENLDEDKIRRIWKYGVLPYIEERLFGQDEQRLAGFDLDTLRRAVTASGASDEQEEAFPIEDVGAGGNDASD